MNSNPPDAAPNAPADGVPRYRFEDYVRASGSGVEHVSFNALVPKIEYAAEGRPLP